MASDLPYLLGGAGHIDIELSFLRHVDNVNSSTRAAWAYVTHLHGHTQRLIQTLALRASICRISGVFQVSQ